jgi:hypothetical protein
LDSELYINLFSDSSRRNFARGSRKTSGLLEAKIRLQNHHTDISWDSLYFWGIRLALQHRSNSSRTIIQLWFAV